MQTLAQPISANPAPLQERATILHLQRLSTEDGPGIRTTVFFKGCPLRCAWCHNPESLSREPQVQWLERHCIGCRTCLKACPQGALQLSPQGLQRERSICRVCGACVEACPAGAQELLGRQVEQDWLLAELRKDRAYFEQSGGGVTLSGGEPALQPDFALALLRALRAEGIQTALDTCGLCSPAVLEDLVAESDVILFDLKLVDSAAHRLHTGAGNERILANLARLGEILAQQPAKRLWVRTPLIPGATLSEENIRAIGAWLQQRLPGRVERWELCAFNNLCRDKYTRLGLTWAYAATPLLSPDELRQAGEWARGSGFDPQRVHVGGPTRVS